MNPLTMLFPLLFAAQVWGATYQQTDSHQGGGFLHAFGHQAIPDPTHGRVNYVDQDTALQLNLTYAYSDHFVIRTDFTTVLNPNGPGRNSVRLMSYKQYYNHVAVFNVRHMPQGCGTWPAVWECGANWPNEGEIDILEGVNDQSQNEVTLHTSAGCTMPPSRSQIGTSAGDDCGSGCGVRINKGSSYGPGFNSAGGGWYAMERTGSSIKVWFWSRSSSNLPWDVSSGATSVNTDNWGTPSAFFPGTSCDINRYFGPQNIIINISLCGDWADPTFNAGGCPGNCVDYVNNNPAAFKDAYFDFQWVKVYS